MWGIFRVNFKALAQVAWYIGMNFTKMVTIGGRQGSGPPKELQRERPLDALMQFYALFWVFTGPLAHCISASQMPELPQAGHSISLGFPGTLGLQETVGYFCLT